MDGNGFAVWRAAVRRDRDGCPSGQVISGAFYAIGDTRTPTMLFIGTFTIYIPIKILVFLRYGVIGLAAVTSVHLAVNFLLQLLVLERAVARSAQGLS